jgi:BirA family transcriptional regulator, biotin operon repressor / biotin---[acetyl-CoA-carboxylase] ligase
MKITLLNYDSIDSTNTEALKQARLGADEGVCIVARQQTAGRGRHGRTWLSEKDSGLYFSIILRPTIETRFLPLITLMAGVAVHDTLTDIGLSPDIKWVNDVHVGGRKISGILAETAETEKGLAVIVGIGINMRSTNFAHAIADIATSIEQESGRSVTASSLAEILTKYLVSFSGLLTAENGHSVILNEWRLRSTYYSGKRIRAATSAGEYFGITDGLEPNGALRIVTDNGSLVIIQTGEIEQLRAGE